MENITIEDIQLLFFKYNSKYFDLALTLPSIKIIHSKKIVGRFSCLVYPDGEFTDPLIEISDAYQYTKEQLRNILVHEMVHYYLVVTKADLKIKHGKAFKHMMQHLNEIYGLNITITIDTECFIPSPKQNWFIRFIHKII